MQISLIDLPDELIILTVELGGLGTLDGLALLLVRDQLLPDLCAEKTRISDLQETLSNVVDPVLLDRHREEHQQPSY